jgi:hypothetical protein
MKTQFGRGSWVEPERQSWDMWYPWPPFFQAYRNESGLRIHLSSEDSDDVAAVLRTAMTSVAAAVANVLGAFAAVVPLIVDRLVRNPDGSIDIRISEHGLQVGNAPAGDPNVWLAGAWIPVAAALRRLGRRATTPR